MSPDSESLESLESLLSESIELLLLALSRRPDAAADWCPFEDWVEFKAGSRNYNNTPTKRY